MVAELGDLGRVAGLRRAVFEQLARGRDVAALEVDERHQVFVVPRSEVRDADRFEPPH